MGLFDKLKNLASNELDSLKGKVSQKVSDMLPDSIKNPQPSSPEAAPQGPSSSRVKLPVSPPVSNSWNNHDDDDYDEFNESSFDEEFNEYDYDEPELSDDDLAEFGERVDELIAENEGDLDDDDIDDLIEEAQEYGITREEFRMMLDSRIEEIREAIEAGFASEDVYSTRSIWRRCPNCGYLNYPNDVYCGWCGYQLRYKAVSAILGSLAYIGALSSGNPSKLHRKVVSKTKKRALNDRKKRVSNKAKGVKPKKKASVASVKRTTPPPVRRNSIAGSSSSNRERLAAKSTAKKESIFRTSPGKSNRERAVSKPSSKSSSLFGSSKKSSSKSSFKPKKSGGMKLKLGKRR